jgi:hypothetical protein
VHECALGGEGREGRPRKEWFGLPTANPSFLRGITCVMLPPNVAG